MTRKLLADSLAYGILTASLCLGISVRSAAAPVAPVKPASVAPTTSMADLLSGKLYPNTVKSSDLIANYHLISIVNALGRLTVCATQGTTLTLGGETFMVVYLPPPPPPAKSADAATPTPPITPADANAQLTLINMRYVQAVGGIRDVNTADVAPPPTVPSAPAEPAPTTGTATP